MKAHQTRMDVIGNNIANVNTYGFKSSRATFRDLYYQNINGAAAASANRGGINPSSVGYGSFISSIDIMMTQSAMTTSGNPLDLAIAGEGFFQVMDSEGNIFYTKAGMLDIDAAGNLVDTNGYFVLGVSGDPLGKAPASNKIQFNIPSVPPTVSKLESSINGKQITIQASNSTKDGNVSFTFANATDLPIGKKAEAIISGTSITVRLNAYENFADMAEVQSVVNAAISEANGGVEHPAGQFHFTMAATFPTGGLSGAEITGQNYGYNKGSIAMPAVTPTDPEFTGFGFVSVGDHFTSFGATTFKVVRVPAAAPVEEHFTITVDVGGTAYTGTITKSQMETPNNLMLYSTSGDVEDNIRISLPTYNTFFSNNSTLGVWNTMSTATPLSASAAANAVASTPSNDLGLSERAFKLAGGTEGGIQTIKDLTGIAIGSDGVIEASHPVHGRMLIGRIDLATFDNPQGLQQSGNSYFSRTTNSGAPALTRAGEGGTGNLMSSTLEMSNVDLSQEFSDMITTQRGFQANSRLITVSDSMLEELINLKR